VFSNLVTGFPLLIASLLLIEIGLSYGVPVGVASQIKTVAFATSVIMGLVVGGLSVKVRHKSLLMMGLVFLTTSSVGCFFAPNLIILLLAFSLTGFSTAMVRPMGRAIVGSLFTRGQQPKVVGYILAGMAVTYVIGPPLISLIGDWRSAFIVLVFPLGLIAIFLTILRLPSTPLRDDSSFNVLQGYREVFQNRSALACVIANVFSAMGMVVLVEYGLPFYRQQFHIDFTFVSLMLTGLNLVFLGSYLFGGRIVSRLGRKRVTVVSTFLYGVFILLFMNVADAWLSVILWYVAGLMSSFRDQAFTSLALEQVPAFRGTMMSLSSLSNSLALAIGTSIGGVILLSYDYEFLGLFGILVMMGALVFHFFTIDPIKSSTKEARTLN
jgi:DHA1 family purine base/nucleoside efflux pump-like MFS transporter